MEGAGGTAGPGRGTGEIGRPSCEARGPQCPWAAGPGWTTGQRADRSSRRGWPKWAGLTPPPAEFRMQFPPQHESTQAQKPQNINDQNPNPDMRSRELHAKLLVDSHSWASRRCTEPHVSTLSSLAAHPAPPAPKQPAGPQATASATQQHVVSYNPMVAAWSVD